MTLTDVLKRSAEKRRQGKDTAKDDGDVLPKIELRLSHSYKGTGTQPQALTSATTLIVLESPALSVIFHSATSGFNKVQGTD